MESFCLVCLIVSSSAPPSSSSLCFFDFYFMFQTLHPIFRPKSVVSLMYTFILKLWWCRQVQNRKCSESWVSYEARIRQEGTSCIYICPFQHQSQKNVHPTVSEILFFQQCAKFGYRVCVSYTVCKQGSVSEHFSLGWFCSLYNYLKEAFPWRKTLRKYVLWGKCLKYPTYPLPIYLDSFNKIIILGFLVHCSSIEPSLMIHKDVFYWMSNTMDVTMFDTW